MTSQRNRIHYAILTAMVIVAGCAVRSELTSALPTFLTKCGGDTLWALMIYLGLGFLFPRLGTIQLALTVLAISFSVEFSQLYHTAWLDSFRRTLAGAVILGSGFRWSDLVCYTIGCGTGIIIDVCALNLSATPNPRSGPCPAD